MRRDMVPAVAATAVVGVLGVVALLLSLSGGDDPEETRRIKTPPSRASTTTTSFVIPSTTTSSTTLSPTVITVPPTAAPPVVAPGTIAVAPPGPAVVETLPPTVPTAPPGSTTTTSSTKPPTVPEELAPQLETALAGGVAPVPGFERGVVVEELDGDEDENTVPRTRVTWPLDATLTGEELKIAARVEATALLRVLQGYDRIGDDRVVLRGTLPDDDADGFPVLAFRLVFERDTLDAIDFTTLDPLTIFELADLAVVQPVLQPTPTTTTSTTKP